VHPGSYLIRTVHTIKTSRVIRAATDGPGVPFEISDHLAAEKV